MPSERIEALRKSLQENGVKIEQMPEQSPQALGRQAQQIDASSQNLDKSIAPEETPVKKDSLVSQRLGQQNKETVKEESKTLEKNNVDLER